MEYLSCWLAELKNWIWGLGWDGGQLEEADSFPLTLSLPEFFVQAIESDGEGFNQARERPHDIIKKMGKRNNKRWSRMQKKMIEEDSTLKETDNSSTTQIEVRVLRNPIVA